MQGKRLQVLDDDAAVTVHDALRQAGGAGGVQHPQRVVERDRVKIQRPGLGGQHRPPQRAGQRAPSSR